MREAKPILILGGTTEGYALADALHRGGIPAISSLAGITANPRVPAGRWRCGGFGGVAGLRAYLREAGIGAVIDATHPFARQMGWNAFQACTALGLPLLRLERPAWTPGPGDRWTMVDEWPDAADVLKQSARQVFLALGRKELEAFAGLDTVKFLIRCVDRPDPMPPFRHADLLLARGPFSREAERTMLESRGIDTIVCKNSGGTATDAKLAAARDLGIAVVMRRRPNRPLVATATSVDAARAWAEGGFKEPPEPGR